MLHLWKNNTNSALVCYLSERSYSLVMLDGAKNIRFCEQRDFKEASMEEFAKILATDVDEHHLYGRNCQLILAPSLYQLLMLDALEVPEKDIAKAMRWHLKGLIEYPMNDIVVDAFRVSPHGAGLQRKKVFVAVVLQSRLKAQLSVFADSLLQVTSVSISELCIASLLRSIKDPREAPIIVITYDKNLCQLHVFYMGELYLLRNIAINTSILRPNSSANNALLLEIQRSIDYCLGELKLPMPYCVVLSPSFYEAIDLVDFLHVELNKDVYLIDINTLFDSLPLPNNILAEAYYAIGWALQMINKV